MPHWRTLGSPRVVLASPQLFELDRCIGSMHPPLLPSSDSAPDFDIVKL